MTLLMGFNSSCTAKLSPKEIAKLKAECAWVRQIKFSEETKKWLATLEWPPSAFKDFSKIKRFNIKVNKFCKSL